MTFSPQYDVTAAPEENDRAFGLPLDFLKVESGEDDETIEALLDAAVDWGEVWTNRVFKLTGFTGRFPAPCYLIGSATQRPFVEIRKSPLIDVTALRYYSPDSDTIIASTPTVDRRATYSRVFFPRDFADTFDTDGQDFPIEVDFTAGYSVGTVTGSQQAMPPSVLTGIKQHVAYLYENRGNVEAKDDAVPEEVKRSYMPIRIFRTAL